MELISKENLINEEIREKQVRLIDSEGNQLGFVSSREALSEAQDRGLDLVMIAPQAKPPVCKIMDYGKYLYELQKKDKEAKKKQKVVCIKEIRISPGIEEHDLNVKMKNGEKFLKEGNKVKVTVKFRGREADYSHFGKELLTKIGDKLQEVGVIEKQPKLEGRSMSMFMAPKKV